MNIGVHVVNAARGPPPTPSCRSGRGRKRWGSSRCGSRTKWSSRAILSRPIRTAGPSTTTSKRNQNFFEALTVLTYLAGRTSRVHLGTSVLVVPYRQPLVVAKQWATLDAFSGGRTILGVGARASCASSSRPWAWTRSTDAARPPTRRSASSARSWAPGAEVSFTGEVYRFPPVRFLPKPVRPGGPPIWVGGNGRRSIRRAAELGDGWHSVRIGLDELRTGVATLHELLDRNGRRRLTSSSRRNSNCTLRGPARGESRTSPN